MTFVILKYVFVDILKIWKLSKRSISLYA